MVKSPPIQINGIGGKSPAEDISKFLFKVSKLMNAGGKMIQNCFVSMFAKLIQDILVQCIMYSVGCDVIQSVFVCHV